MGYVTKFLSTPSARRATQSGKTCTCVPSNFYPRPPRGGRHAHISIPAPFAQFLSTPSARRATAFPVHAHSLHTFLSTPSARRATNPPYKYALEFVVFLSTPSARRATPPIPSLEMFKQISIHALREEGDMPTFTALRWILNFYPRPPRGGRPSRPTCLPQSAQFLSTPSARRATAYSSRSARFRTISIHALREEGDLFTCSIVYFGGLFLSTPSARRATSCANRKRPTSADFYPRPPRGGRPELLPGVRPPVEISIHALREEGDQWGCHNKNSRWRFLSTPSARRATDHVLARVNAQCISIHALREEGDGAGLLLSTCKQLFLSTPSARRATRTGSWNFWTATFLSTPSARRATCPYPVIHVFIVFLSTPSARRATDRKIYAVLYRLFLSTPSARRATPGT